MTWQPGQSGNPSALPGRKPFRDAITMELAMWQNGQCDPVPRNSPRSLIRAQILKAEKGELAALTFLAERCEGKPSVQITGDADMPIAVQVSRGDEAATRISEALARIGSRIAEVDAVALSEDTEGQQKR